MLTGFYTPSLDSISINAPGVFIIQPDRPTCLALVDITGDGATRTVTVTKGTWDGVTFTPIQLIGHISANNGDSNQIALFAMVNIGEAVQVLVT